MSTFNVGDQFADRQNVSDEFLLREAAHRYKNLLSVVRAISAQTGRFHTNLNDFQGALDQRLFALSESHDLVLRSVSGADLRELVQSQLNVVIGKDDLGLIEIHGPNLRLNSAFTQAMGIGLYELATNSVKHGALRRQEGSVKITWNYSESKDTFFFMWLENGNHGNTVSRQGFGHLVLEHIVPDSAHGTADLIISPVGISWVLKTPLTGVQEKIIDRIAPVPA